MTKEDGFKADLVKIIRDDSLGDIAWDSDNVYYSWPKASLQKTLNGSYYNGTLKNDTTRNAIESVVWNLGGSRTYNGVTASMFYERERGTTAIWTGKIGLIYPSDYGYATAGGSTTNRATCMTTNLYDWDGSGVSDCKNNDYLYKSGDYMWTLTSSSSLSGSVFLVDDTGYVKSIMAAGTAGVRPVAFLKSNISITNVGIGTAESPFQLKVG